MSDNNSGSAPKVVPAQLSFLAIYNPLLGQTDEAFHKQVVFYYSKESNANLADNVANDEENEKLRHIGLAQGMVDFARSFANGAPVDSVDTEKSRVVMREIEAEWWILASVDLTVLPIVSNSSTTTKGNEPSKPTVEYSSREVSPPGLLLQQLSQAQRMFRLHHGLNLTELYAKLGRDRFCNTLDRYWSRFAQRWDVLLHGSPAVSIFGGTKLAAGGELGIGVGEEEWGSGEREVLEEFARRTDGLVDVVVSRFGDPAKEQSDTTERSKSKKKDARLGSRTPWMGSGQTPGAPDGVVFSGVGGISRSSLRDISQWVESIYAYGEYAYGVKDNPRSDRKRRRRRAQREVSNTQEALSSQQNLDTSTLPRGIPRPIVSAAQQSLERASKAVDENDSRDTTSNDKADSTAMSSIADPEAWKYYLTFGYSSWGSKDSHPTDVKDTEDSTDKSKTTKPEKPAAAAVGPQSKSLRHLVPTPHVDRVEEMINQSIEQENKGHFVIGLKGDLDNIADEETDDSGSEGWNNRILLRTVYVELERSVDSDSTDEDPTDYEKMIKAEGESKKTHTRLRVIMYIHRPFIYTFLFTPRVASLTIASFYQTLHSYFSPLHAPLSASTSPSRIAARIAAAQHPYTTSATPSSNTSSTPSSTPIFDLVFDPLTLTLHSSIPNIPDPGTLSAEGLAGTHPHWTRVDALNVHAAVLDAVLRTRHVAAAGVVEQTGKTSRGWWVVWMRLPPSTSTSTAIQTSENDTADNSSDTAKSNGEATQRVQPSTGTLREAFLVRRARDAGSGSSSKGSASGRAVSGLWKMGLGGSGEKMGGRAEGWGPKGVAEGIGIDARKYVETLLSLNR